MPVETTAPAPPLSGSAPGGPTRRSMTGARSLLRELAADRLGLAAAVVLFGLVGIALFAPWVAPHDPASQSLGDRLQPPFWLDGGDFSHPLGTDNLGRDVLSRLIFGARTSLAVGAAVVLLAGTVGTLVGLFSGYLGGRTDSWLMRLVDTQTAFPGVLLGLVLLSVLGPSFGTVVLVLTINGWMVYGRTMRGIVLGAKERQYVEAAVVAGASTRRIVLRHILPNLTFPLMTLGILEFARIILAEAALSFLGIGIQPPATSWGLDVSIGKEYMFRAWWLTALPGAAMAITVMAVNLMASWMRVTMDPVEREKRFSQRTVSRRRKVRMAQ